MDDDDIYGSILSDPKSNSNSNKYSDHYSDNNPQHQQQQQYYQTSQQGQGQFSIPPFFPQPSLFISNLTWWTSEDDLRQLLGDLSNRIKELQFLENKSNGKSKGTVIIEFVDVSTAEMAKGILEGKEISGRVCEVSFARNPPVKPYERTVGNYNQRGERPAPRQYHRPEQQYNPNHRHGNQVIYSPHYQTQDEHSHRPSRLIYREEPAGFGSGYDHRQSSSSKYRETSARDDRSRSPDRRSFSKSRRH